MRVSIVTTSKGRLHHIRETVPRMLASGADEVVVVDSGCPDGTGDWVERHCPGARVLRVTDDPGFCLPRARNLGARAAQGDWIAFVDGDVMVAPGWGDWMRGHLSAGHFYRAGPIGDRRHPETWGSAICARRDFDSVGGYDEVFRGWGGEDTDLYLRLEQSGVIESDYPPHFVTAIPHGDDERTAWSDLKSREAHLFVNRCYTAAKQQLTALLGVKRPPDLDTRARLMAATKTRIVEWGCDPAKPPPELVYRVEVEDWLPPPFTMKKQLVFTIRIEQGARRRRDPAYTS